MTAPPPRPIVVWPRTVWLTAAEAAELYPPASPGESLEESPRESSEDALAWLLAMRNRALRAGLALALGRPLRRLPAPA